MSANPILDNPPPRTRKYCPGCKTIKSVDDFYRNAAAYDSLNPYCKPCWNAYQRERAVAKSRRISWEISPAERWDIEERIASIEERNAADAPWGYSAFHDGKG